ncbi:hypothetical protein BGZ83_006900 [Gryganskiella cystojenkinii]|nr:hypothetical protein BGZ83_006900 [Gryganskiella cystojenkinii]
MTLLSVHVEYEDFVQAVQAVEDDFRALLPPELRTPPREAMTEDATSMSAEVPVSKRAKVGARHHPEEAPSVHRCWERHLLSVRKALDRGYLLWQFQKLMLLACELALLSIIQWTQLYKAMPSAFDISDTSESFWCREGWPILRRMLGNVDGITMIDGENTTYESKNRRNKSRRLDVEGQVHRKRKGKNVSMVG